MLFYGIQSNLTHKIDMQTSSVMHGEIKEDIHNYYAAYMHVCPVYKTKKRSKKTPIPVMQCTYVGIGYSHK